MGHHSNESAVRRLKRAAGHLHSVIAMLEESKPCLEIAQQMHAVEAALKSAKVSFLEDHINNCLRQSLSDPAAAREILDDFGTITKYLR